MKLIQLCFFFALGVYNGHSQCVPIVAPWSDDVEAHVNSNFVNNSLCWGQTANFDIEWRANSVTPTIGTGPNAANSGTKFFFLESSGGNTGQEANLSTPTIDVSTLTNPSLEFWYYMYGSDIGDLKVELSTDDGNTWSTIWSISGQQHSLPDISWSRQVIDVNAQSDSVKVRFKGSSTGNLGDIAIDDISFFDCSISYATVEISSCNYYTSPSGKLLYDSGVYVDTIENSIGCDSIITIFLHSSNTSTEIAVSDCYYTTSKGTVLTSSGIYHDTLTNANGCDSIVSIYFDGLASSAVINEAACNNYYSPNGLLYKKSGTYLDTLSNANGCDSIVTINLTLSHDVSSTLSINTCGGPYTSNAGITYNSTGFYAETHTAVSGCDSTVFIDLFVSHPWTMNYDITACQSFVSDGGYVYQETGAYTELYISSTGCDSVINYNVILNEVDPSLSNNPSYSMLIANQNNAIYQWVDCDMNNAIIPGEVYQSFNVSHSGNYACLISYEECTILTECVSFLSLDAKPNNIFSVYPNPADDRLTLQLNTLEGQAYITILDMTGKMVYTAPVHSQKSQIELNTIASGTYIVEVSNGISARKEILIIN